MPESHMNMPPLPAPDVDDYWGVAWKEEKVRAYARAYAALALAKSAAPLRILFGSDAYCPNCGHDRDHSSVSSINHGDTIHSCQMCGAKWKEQNAAAQEWADTARIGGDAQGVQSPGNGEPLSARTSVASTPVAAAPTPLQNERAAFEAWARPNWFLERHRLNPDSYSDSGTECAWRGWQARAALKE